MTENSLKRSSLLSQTLPPWLFGSERLGALLSQTFAVNQRAASQGLLSQNSLAVNSPGSVKNNSF